MVDATSSDGPDETRVLRRILFVMDLEMVRIENGAGDHKGVKHLAEAYMDLKHAAGLPGKVMRP